MNVLHLFLPLLVSFFLCLVLSFHSLGFSLNNISKKFSWHSCHDQFSLLFSITEICFPFIKPILNNKFPHLFDSTSSCVPTTVEVLFILSSVPKTICATLRIRNKQVINCWLNGSMEKLPIPGVSGTVIVKPQAKTQPYKAICHVPLHYGFQFPHDFSQFSTERTFTLQ